MRALCLVGFCVVGVASLQTGRAITRSNGMGVRRWSGGAGAIPKFFDGITMAEVETMFDAMETKVVVVTHAGGRMGTQLVAQLREEFGESVTVRAIVRSEEEATKLLCDLYGVKLKSGKMEPLVPKCGSWVTPFVVDANCPDEALEVAFAGATSAVLCDALHTELVTDGDSQARSVRVPEGSEQSKRLPRMLKACAASPSLSHVVLRSSMGIACAASCAAEPGG